MELSEIAHKIDLLYEKRAARIAADKAAADLKKEETKLSEEVLQMMREHDLSALGGNRCTVKVRVERKPTVADWTALYEYIKEHDAFDLLHKRLTEGAVKLRAEDDVQVPGVGWFEKESLTYSDKR